MALKAAAAVALLAMGEVQGEVPTFPQGYRAVVKFSMPYIPLEMPIHILTSSSQQKVEYYDGLEQDWSDSTGVYKYVYNNSHRSCLFTPASAGPTSVEAASWSAMPFFPDLSKYTQGEDAVIGGILCKTYVLDATHGTTGAMNDHSTFYWDDVLKKPVRWHIHARHPTFGSHTDEYIFDFFLFEEGSPAVWHFKKPDICKEPQVANVDMHLKHLLHAVHSPRVPHVLGDEVASVAFKGFLQSVGRSYSAEELPLRQATFEKNLKLIRDLNEKHAGKATFKGNQFLDMTKEEVLRFRGGKSSSGPREARRSQEDQQYISTYKHKNMLSDVTDFDWRTAKPGVVTPVKDQGMCGSCWTYGLTEPIESIQAIKTDAAPKVLPEQYVLDCTWTDGASAPGASNAGCDGGESDVGALLIVKNFGGIVPTAASYGSYLSVDGYCRDVSKMDVGAKITGWTDIKSRDEKGLLEALQSEGPISIGIQVPDEMLYYDSGVLNVDGCQNKVGDIDHAVTLTGFGTENGVEYYTIRNSWSTYWGDEGYVKIARGERDCCVSCEAGFPQVETATENLVV